MDVIMLESTQIPDSLAQQFGDLSERVEELDNGSKNVPDKIEDQETADKLTMFLKQISVHGKHIEDSRKASGQPYLDSKRTVDDWFKAYKVKTDKLLSDLKPRLSAWQMEQEKIRRAEAQRVADEQAALAAKQAAEAKTEEDELRAAKSLEQADKADAKVEVIKATVTTESGTAALQMRWTCTSFDRSKLDLEALRAHLGDDAIEKALRSVIRAGTHKVEGAVIEQVATTTIR